MIEHAVVTVILKVVRIAHVYTHRNAEIVDAVVVMQLLPSSTMTPQAYY